MSAPRVLLVGDIHVSDAAPVNCYDTYTEDILAILTWIADYAKDEKIDAVVWAGDIFHHKAPSRNSHALVLKMIRVVETYLENGVPLWIVAGNHDLSNDVLDTLHTKQPLGVLFAAGARELVGWHPSLPLYGVPWQQDWTTDTPTALAAFKGWQGDPRASEALVVTHAPVYPPVEVERGVPFDLVPTSGPDSLAEAMGGTGYLYYGHIHEDHGIFEDGGVTFANMGAISRGSLTEYNMKREVKIALWTPAAGFTEVAVPHKPASEVFRVEQAAEIKEDKVALETFLSAVGGSTLDISSTASVISHLRTRADVRPIVRDRAISLLEEQG